MSQIILYQSEDGSTKLDVQLEGQTLWLNQKQLMELYGKAKGTISEHIKHIFEDGELKQGATVRLFRTVQIEGRRKVTRISMTMKDWITKLEGFLSLNDREILNHAGKISAELAKSHAEREFIEFRKAEDLSLESDFDKAIRQLPPPPNDP